MNYRAIQIEVDARQVTRQNVRELAEWCGGNVFGGPPTRAMESVFFDGAHGAYNVAVGEWIVKYPDGTFSAGPTEKLLENFEPIPEPVVPPLKGSYAEWLATQAGPAIPTTGIGAFDMERHRQKHTLGFTEERDDLYSVCELTQAARAYAECAYWTGMGWELPKKEMGMWPWDREWWKPSTDPQRNLAKAGALLAAEWDRLERIRVREAGTINVGDKTAPRPPRVLRNKFMQKVRETPDGLETIPVKIDLRPIDYHKDHDLEPEPANG